MKNLAIILLCLLAVFGLTSCGADDSDTIANREIRDIMYDISNHFNLKNAEGIMEHLHIEYLHKGLISYHFNDLWLDRMTQFSLLEIEILYIELQENKAIVHSKNTFSSAFETQVLNEPEDSGDISYFIRDNGVWRIYGNQLWSKANANLQRKGNLLVTR
ncbi:MAG: hypothetical protein PHO32_00150 [Candidatus Cloacimonetes bacterium]|nr:hypothetical protein [Candidatus Cloacimonadota bacterium]